MYFKCCLKEKDNKMVTFSPKDCHVKIVKPVKNLNGKEGSHHCSAVSEKKRIK